MMLRPMKPKRNREISWGMTRHSYSSNSPFTHGQLLHSVTTSLCSSFHSLEGNIQFPFKTETASYAPRFHRKWSNIWFSISFYFMSLFSITVYCQQHVRPVISLLMQTIYFLLLLFYIWSVWNKDQLLFWSNHRKRNVFVVEVSAH